MNSRETTLTNRPRGKSGIEIQSRVKSYDEAVRVFSFCGSQALGDFINELVYSVTIAQMLNNSELTIAYSNDRKYKNYLSSLFDDKTTLIALQENQTIPMNWFGVASGENMQSPHGWWYERLIHMPDLLLTPAMMKSPGSLPVCVRAKIPDKEEQNLRQRLILRGIDPDRWIVGMHLREKGYIDRSDSADFFNVDVSTYIKAIEYIYKNGGQVVRIGDKSSTPLSSLEGVIDIVDDDVDLPLQVYAFSKARFNICTNSGPHAISQCLQVPTLSTNAIGFIGWHTFDMCLNKTMITKTGDYFSTSDQFDFEISHGSLYPVGPFYLNNVYKSFIDNTPDQLVEATQCMMDQTFDCTIWRTEYPDDHINSQRNITWPIPVQHCKFQLLDIDFKTGRLKKGK